MTVQVTDRLSQLYVGNGVNTRFDFTFRVFNQEDETGVAVRVKVGDDFEFMDEALYAVTVNEGNLGGYITFVEAPDTSTFFYIGGKTPVDQLLDITNYDNFYPDALERALDKLTAILQEWKHLVDFETQARILADINYDILAKARENELKSYIDGLVANINDDSILGAQFITQVEAVDDLDDLLKWDGRTVYVKSYYAGLNRGGGKRIYNSARSHDNDGFLCINGWVLANPKYTFEEAGVKGGDPLIDDSILMQNAIDALSSTKVIGGVGDYTGAKLSCEVAHQKYYIQNTLKFEKTTADNAAQASKFPVTVDWNGSIIVPTVNNLKCILINRWFINFKQPRIQNELNKTGVTGVYFGNEDLTTRQVMGFCFNRIYDLHTDGLETGVLSIPAASSGGLTTNSYYNELYSPVFLNTDTAIHMDGNANALDNQSTRFTLFNPRHLYGKCTFKLECTDTLNVFGGSAEMISDSGNPNSAVIYIPNKWTDGVNTHSIENSASFHGFVAESCDRAYYNGSYELTLNDCNFIGMSNLPITVGSGREHSRVKGNLDVIEDRSGRLSKIGVRNENLNVQMYFGVGGTGVPQLYADAPISASSFQTLTATTGAQAAKYEPISGQLVFKTHLAAHSLLVDTQTANIVSFYNSGGGITRFGGSTAITPWGDNNTTCGNSANRWSSVYAATGTIQTSDERYKQQFRAQSEAEKAAAIAIKESICLFKFNDSVDLKGDGARWHVGVKAQQVVAILEAHGLKWEEYGFICYDEWEGEPDSHIVTTPEVVDGDGNVLSQEEVVTIKGVESGNRYSIRYDELTMFILNAL